MKNRSNEICSNEIRIRRELPVYKLSIYFQGELQFYDTPRNLLNDIPATSVPDSYGNYDTPQQPLPVYRKPCGCIMKLIKLNGKYQSTIQQLL